MIGSTLIHDICSSNSSSRPSSSNDGHKAPSRGFSTTTKLLVGKRQDLYVIANPSVCRLYVCNVGAPYALNFSAIFLRLAYGLGQFVLKF